VERRTSVALLLCLIAVAIGIPVGLAIAEGDGNRDTTPVLDGAGASTADGPDAASRELMTPEESRRAESFPDPPNVPSDTKVYVAPYPADDELVQGCHRRLAEAPDDELCQLYLLHAEGKARGGAYSAAEAADALQRAHSEEAAEEASK